MNSFTATTKILENLNKKYRHLDNIMNLTKDMEKAMLANDTFSFGKLLDMRGDLMIMVDELDKENYDIVGHLPGHLQEKIAAIIMPKKNMGAETLSLDNPLETNIYDTNKRIAVLLGKIIKLDNEINEKVRSKQTARRLGNLRG